MTRVTGVRDLDVIAWLERATSSVESEQDELNRLDGAAGDGDHGATMVMGFRAILRDVRSQPTDGSPGTVLRTAGASFASVGGSAGPLWGTALLRAGRACGASNQLDLQTVLAAAQAALEGIEQRGRSSPGSKTLLDAMAPAVDALREALDSDASLSHALSAAAQAAHRGAEATREMVPLRGRARRLADRSIGHVDPGAASCALIWAAAADACQAS